MDGGGPQSGPQGPSAGGAVDTSNQGQNEALSGKMQAQMWQEQHYMGGGGGAESGFISASTTQPSSRSGHEDNLEDGCYTGPGSITGGSLYDMDSAAPSEVNSVASSSYLGLDPAEKIPGLVTNLRDDDDVVVQESLNLVDRSVRKDNFNVNFFNAVIRSADMVCAIVNALSKACQTMIDTSMTSEAREEFEAAECRARTASDILRAMTNPNNRDGPAENQKIACRNILHSGGVTAITGLMACNVDRIKFNGAITIHSLLLCLDEDEQDKVKHQVREANGVRVMVALLERNNVKLLTILCDCLRILAYRDQQTKNLILQGGGPTKIIEILKHTEYNNLIHKAAQLLKVLSVCPQNKPAIIKAGGMEALAKHLQSQDQTIPYHCSWTMRNLSDVTTNIANPDGLAEKLVQLLHHRDTQVTICAAGIISNLTVNNEALKLSVCRAKGIQELVRVVDVHGQNKDLLEPAMCALRHLTNNHDNADAAQKLFIQDLDGLTKLARWMQPETNRPCLKAVLGVVRNLALKMSNHTIMRERGFVHQILRIFSLTYNDLNHRGSHANKSVDGVKLTDILEICLNCINWLSKSHENQAIIRDPAIISILKTFLNNPSVTIQKVSAGILHELAQEKDGAYIIFKVGSCDSIRALVDKYQEVPNHQKIASYAISILNEVESIKKELDRGTYRPPPPIQQQNPMQPPMFHHQPPQPQPPQHPPQGMFANQGPPPPHHHMPGPPQRQPIQRPPPMHQQPMPPQQDMFGNAFPPNYPTGGDMGQTPGFDEMMSEPPMHHIMPPHGAPMPGFEGGPMGGPPPPGQPFMTDDMGMEMFNPDDPNFPQGYYGDAPI